MIFIIAYNAKSSIVPLTKIFDTTKCTRIFLSHCCKVIIIFFHGAGHLALICHAINELLYNYEQAVTDGSALNCLSCIVNLRNI